MVPPSKAQHTNNHILCIPANMANALLHLRRTSTAAVKDAGATFSGAGFVRLGAGGTSSRSRGSGRTSSSDSYSMQL
jgi:hypothetical protein